MAFLFVVATACGTSSTVWNVILDDSSNVETYNGYVPTSLSDHYLLVDMTFENATSGDLVLVTSDVLDVRDASGNHYAEAQASDPTHKLVVPSGENVHVTTAYVVPDSTCSFQVALVGRSVPVKQWTITSSYAGCP